MTNHRLTVNIEKIIGRIQSKIILQNAYQQREKSPSEEIKKYSKISLLQDIMTAVFQNKVAIMSNAADQ